MYYVSLSFYLSIYIYIRKHKCEGIYAMSCASFPFNSAFWVFLFVLWLGRLVRISDAEKATHFHLSLKSREKKEVCGLFVSPPLSLFSYSLSMLCVMVCLIPIWVYAVPTMMNNGCNFSRTLKNWSLYDRTDVKNFGLFLFAWSPRTARILLTSL